MYEIAPKYDRRFVCTFSSIRAVFACLYLTSLHLSNDVIKKDDLEAECQILHNCNHGPSIHKPIAIYEYHYKDLLDEQSTCDFKRQVIRIIINCGGPEQHSCILSLMDFA